MQSCKKIIITKLIFNNFIVNTPSENCINKYKVFREKLALTIFFVVVFFFKKTFQLPKKLCVTVKK